MPADAGRLLPALAATAGSVLVGFMPLMARHLYADGIDVPSMLLWRYAIALPALITAAMATRLDAIAAWRAGAGRILLVGATLGTAQTICFWESIKYIDTGLADLLFYCYPALTLVLDRMLFKRPVGVRAALCVGVILFGAGLITLPGLRGGAIDLRGLAWAIPSPLIYVFYLAANSVLLRRQRPLGGAIALYLGMALSFAAISLGDGLDVPQTADAWLLMVAAALGPGALVITLFSYSVPRLGPSSYAIIANMELVTVVTVGVSLLGERMTPERAAGAGLIVAGIIGYGLVQHPGATPARPDGQPPSPAILAGAAKRSRSG